MAVVRFDSEKTEGSGDLCQQPGTETLLALLWCEEGALAASFSPQRGFSWAFSEPDITVPLFGARSGWLQAKHVTIWVQYGMLSTSHESRHLSLFLFPCLLLLLLLSFPVFFFPQGLSM